VTRYLPECAEGDLVGELAWKEDCVRFERKLRAEPKKGGGGLAFSAEMKWSLQEVKSQMMDLWPIAPNPHLAMKAPKKRIVPKNQRAPRKLEVPKILWVMATQG
jgi:hypothetical protein